MTVATECDIPGFSLEVNGSEVDVLRVKIHYDGSNTKFGERPLTIEEFWIVQSPSPCHRTLPAGYDFLRTYKQPAFDWEFGNFCTPVSLIVLSENSSFANRSVEIQAFVHEAKNPKMLVFFCGDTVMDDT